MQQEGNFSCLLETKLLPPQHAYAAETLTGIFLIVISGLVVLPWYKEGRRGSHVSARERPPPNLPRTNYK